MSQLGALVWLKWRLFRNSLRSRRAAASRIASLLATFAGLALSLVVASGAGAAAYLLSSPRVRESAEFSKFAGGDVLFFTLAASFIYLMWAVVPLGLEGGSRFEPRRMLLYPISLPKLFAVDLLSELTNLSSIFAIPVVLALGLGAGLAQAQAARGLLIAALAVAFGVALSKLFSTFVGALMSGRRTRGETVLALLGAALGMAGVFMGQLIERLAPQVARYEGSLRGLRWTPPGALASALTEGLRAGGAGAYAMAAATLAAYTLACVAVTYLIARRTALGAGGAKRSAKLRAEGAGPAESYAGWQLPLMSPELSAVVEKEVRYALRNAQLRAIALMAVALTIVMRMATGRGSAGRLFEGVGEYTEGMQLSYAVLYVFLLVSAISTNLFGYDGAGVRALVLSPVSRRTILVGKDIASTLIVLVLSAASVAASAVAFRDTTWRAVAVAALSFVVFAGFFALGGNWLSLRFPKRVEFGRRMNRSGVAGLLILPFVVVLAVPPALSSFAAYASGSVAVRYVILALFALTSVAAYALFIGAQARNLEEREREIMEAVTGRDEESGQVLG